MSYTLSKKIAVIAIGLCSIAGTAQAQLEINLDFTNFDSGPTGDVSTILNGASLAEAKSVISHAANIWEDVFENSQSSLSWANSGVLTQDIAVGWASHSGNTLATGGTSWFGGGDNQLTSGALNWDGDASSSFFVDTTPGDNNEWNSHVESDLDFNGVDINVQRFSYNGINSTVTSNSDMLTTAIHEIAHALGFLGSYPRYDAADIGGDNDIDITSGPFNGAEIGINGGHTDITIGTPFGGSSTYNPTVMAPGLYLGTRYGLTEADIAIVAQYLEFDMSTVNFAPVPEPSSMMLLFAGSGLILTRRRRAAH